MITDFQEETSVKIWEGRQHLLLLVSPSFSIACSKPCFSVTSSAIFPCLMELGWVENLWVAGKSLLQKVKNCYSDQGYGTHTIGLHLLWQLHRLHVNQSGAQMVMCAHLPVQSTQTPCCLSSCCSLRPWWLSCAPSFSAMSRRTFSAYSRGSARSSAEGMYGDSTCTDNAASAKQVPEWADRDHALQVLELIQNSCLRSRP